jgi:hypothetical protein
MANVDFRSLVNEVSDRFEADNQMPVTPGAREELIEPALPYKDHVEQELLSGKITYSFLGESVYTVLMNAMEIAKGWGRAVIAEDTIQLSMKRYCPYLFWC